jgi:ligand-binding sensor domain-containing protein
MRWAAGFLLLIIAAVGHADAAVGVWKTYTSKREVRSAVTVGDRIWAASSGGMFSVRLADESFQEFTASEGLRSNDLTAVAADRDGNIWIGSSGGLVHIYTPSAGEWKYITDLARESSPQKRINVILPVADTVFIASEIGLSVYLVGRGEFRSTARSFGASPQIAGSVNGVIIFRDTIWVSTANGIAAAPRRHPNLTAPESWVAWALNNTVTLAVFRNQIYAGSSQGLRRFDGNGWQIVSGTTGYDIVGLASGADSLYFITSTQLLALDAAGTVSPLAAGFSSQLRSLTVSGTNIVVGSSANGVSLREFGIWQSHTPPGPPTNHIVGLSMDARGRLWAGTAADGGEGFMNFDGKQWRSYTAQRYPQLGTNEYYKVNVDRDDRKWACSWGAGVAMVDAEDSIRVVYNARNGLVPTLANNRDFVVVLGVVSDREGRACMGIRTGNGDTTFAVLNPDGSFSYARFSYPGVSNIPKFIGLEIDAYGTKWLTNAKPSEVDAVGLYYYNERGFPGSDPSTKWGWIGKESGLPSNKIYAIAVDASGEVWVGTDVGIGIILNPYSLRPSLASYFPLRDQQINSIAVDALDNKWVATKRGVSVLSPDGTSIIVQYTVENTDAKLIDDDIVSLAIDSKTGTVYFGSEKGLSTLTTSAIAPVRSFDELTISPNPLYVPAAVPVTIDGLVQNSILKVLTIDGKLVREIKTPGGRIGFWDGTDISGRSVATGVYVIVAYSESGSQVAAGKIAVIRR